MIGARCYRVGIHRVPLHPGYANGTMTELPWPTTVFGED